MRIVSFFITAPSIIALGLVFLFTLGRFKCLKGSKQPHKCSVSAGERAEWLINTKAVIKKKIEKENKPVMEENEALEATSVIAVMMIILMEMTPEWKTAESKEIVTAFEPLC